MTKAGELITVGACVYLVKAMLGWVWAGMEVMVGRHAGQSQDGLVACQEMPEHFPSVRLRHC